MAPYDGDEDPHSTTERAKLQFEKGGRLYIHKYCRINYTTYDGRRNQDTINTTTHSGIMLLSHDEEETRTHPFWYAQVAGIFHVVVRYERLPPVTMHFLWVRWLGLDPDYPCGWAHRRLPRVGFVPEDGTTDTFGFLDPAVVVRAAHFMPAFHHGRTNELLGPSIARPDEDEDEDWQFYYVGMYVSPYEHLRAGLTPHDRFVDRDMIVRYRGDGIGHLGMRYDIRRYGGDRVRTPDAASSSVEDLVEERQEDHLDDNGEKDDEGEEQVDEGEEQVDEDRDEEDEEGVEDDAESEESDGPDLSPEDDMFEEVDRDDDPGLYGFAAP
jgi:hypothetical protein